MSTIFTKSVAKRRVTGQSWTINTDINIDPALWRQELPLLPETSELEVIRHVTRLSQQNFSIDTHFYPLGSCTMKYNPRIALKCALDPAIANIRPWQDISTTQGLLSMLYELQNIIVEIS